MNEPSNGGEGIKKDGTREWMTDGRNVRRNEGM